MIYPSGTDRHHCHMSVVYLGVMEIVCYGFERHFYHLRENSKALGCDVWIRLCDEFHLEVMTSVKMNDL
jgi:hypothetical protein